MNTGTKTGGSYTLKLTAYSLVELFGQPPLRSVSNAL